MNPTLKIVVGSVTSVIVTLITGAFLLKGQMDANNSALVGTLLEEQNELKEEVRQYRDEAKDCLDKLKKQEALVATFEAFYQHLPEPAWLKSVDPSRPHKSEMFRINTAYEREFGVTALKYQGQADSVVWGAQNAYNFWLADSMVIATKDWVVTTEIVPNRPVNPTEWWEWRIWKFPVVSAGEFIGVGGIAVEKIRRVK